MDKKHSLKIHQDVPISILLLAVGGYLYHLTTKMLPGAALFPQISLIVFMILMFLVLIGGLRKSVAASKSEDGEDIRLLKWEQNKMPYALFGITVVYVIMMNKIGFFPATTVFIPLTMLFFNNRNWKLISAMTAGTLLFVYLLFVLFLKATLP